MKFVALKLKHLISQICTEEHVVVRKLLLSNPQNRSATGFTYSELWDRCLPTALPAFTLPKKIVATDACIASDNSCIRYNISLLPKPDLLVQCSPVKEVSCYKGNSFNYSWIQDRRIPWGITLMRAVRSQSSQKFQFGYQLF